MFDKKNRKYVNQDKDFKSSKKSGILIVCAKNCAKIERIARIAGTSQEMCAMFRAFFAQCFAHFARFFAQNARKCAKTACFCANLCANFAHISCRFAQFSRKSAQFRAFSRTFRANLCQFGVGLHCKLQCIKFTYVNEK